MSKKSGINNTPTRDQINRKFDSMFPGVSVENQRHLQDTLVGGRTYADHQRAIRSRVSRQNLEEALGFNNELPTLEELKEMPFIVIEDFEGHKEYLYRPQTDENGELVIDIENKKIAFICEDTGETIDHYYT